MELKHHKYREFSSNHYGNVKDEIDRKCQSANQTSKFFDRDLTSVLI